MLTKQKQLSRNNTQLKNSLGNDLGNDLGVLFLKKPIMQL